MYSFGNNIYVYYRSGAGEEGAAVTNINALSRDISIQHRPPHNLTYICIYIYIYIYISHM